MKSLYEILREYVGMEDPPPHLVVDGDGELLALFGFAEMDGHWVITLEEARKQVDSLGAGKLYEGWAANATNRHMQELLGDRPE